MTAVLLYVAVLLMVASVVVNRTGERRVKAAREQLAAADKDLRALDQEFQEAGKALDLAQKRLAGLDARVAEAQATVGALERHFETVQQAPVERYYVFDRLEPRPGALWEVPVRRSPDVLPGSVAQAAAWRNGRTYLLVATNQRDALDRAAQRFPRVSGFEVGPATTCRLFGTGRPATSGADAGPAARQRA